VPGWRFVLTIVSSSVLAAGLYAQPALADGDPASDVLVGQDVFLPQSETIPSQLAEQLDALARQSDQDGHTLKIALIAAPTDLGSVNSLYGQPANYARYLSLELEFVTKASVLIVMPQGVGFARAGKTIPAQQLTGLSIQSGPNGLAETAITAIKRLEPHLTPTPPPTRRVRVPRPTNPQPAQRGTSPAAMTSNASLGQGRPSDSFGQVIADRFETGAEKPIVWAALGIVFAFVALASLGVYLANAWAFRRNPRS
jgi:hypothetical protein